VQVIWVEVAETLEAVMLLSPDLESTTEGVDTNPVPVSPVMLTIPVLYPYAGVIAEIEGAEATAVRVAETVLVASFVTVTV
jgi:hypothetical protein